ncbi:MAG: aminotransferase class III-fold pyridoxal phosphate-dependent enzyme, partial [Actinomycetota bacterium]|nr:aminotransferase class III-fold pyridoxal phosphate-dependent enzyme [Actinomycetota bacterium]
MAGGAIGSELTSVFPRFLDVAYPSVQRGDGIWLTTTDERRVLDACSGGAMVACLGYGVPEIVEAAVEQAERISYFYNHHFTSEPQERLADRLLEVVAPRMARVRLVSGGSEANETALQLARLYHVERGDTERWRVISQAQAYHGSTMGTLA